MRLLEKQQNLRVKGHWRDQRGDGLMVWLAIAAVVHVVLVMAILIRWQVMRHEGELAGDRRPIQVAPVPPVPSPPTEHPSAAASPAPSDTTNSASPNVMTSGGRSQPTAVPAIPSPQAMRQDVLLMQPSPSETNRPTGQSLVPYALANNPTQALVPLTPPAAPTSNRALFSTRPVLAVQPLPGTVMPSPSPVASPPPTPVASPPQIDRARTKPTTLKSGKSGQVKSQGQRSSKTKLKPLRSNQASRQTQSRQTQSRPAKAKPTLLPTPVMRLPSTPVVSPSAPSIIRRELLVPSQADQGATATNGVSATLNQALVNYITTAQKLVYDKWNGLAETINSQNARTPVIRFGINRQGQVVELEVVSSSGVAAIDQLAIQAIRSAAPFAALPEQLGGDVLSLSMQFDYKTK